MKYSKLMIEIAVICLMVITFMSCSSSTETNGNGSGISEAEAVEVAKSQIVSAGVMINLDDRDEVTVDEGANWHVYFPLKEALDVLGGEPHVIVEKTDGTVVRIYYTQ